MKAAGAEVTDLTNIPGSNSARQAQVQGEIDAMWEYTGTAWISYLGEDEPIEGTEEQYEAVAERDLAENDLRWLPPTPANNTYGFAMTAQSAERLGITKLSQIQDIPVDEAPSAWESEFENRPDGLPGMLKTYDIPRGEAQGTPDDNIGLYQTGAIYEATAQGECTSERCSPPTVGSWPSTSPCSRTTGSTSPTTTSRWWWASSWSRTTPRSRSSSTRWPPS